jgi:hypothetical protein
MYIYIYLSLELVLLDTPAVKYVPILYAWPATM